MTYKDIMEEFKKFDREGERFKYYSSSFARFLVRVEDFKRFACLFPNQSDIDGGHSDSPTMREFLEVLEDEDLLECYIVSEERPDHRVTVDGAISMSRKRMLELEDKACMASEREMDGPPYRLWWD
jgi:hypothetical protein